MCIFRCFKSNCRTEMLLCVFQTMCRDTLKCHQEVSGVSVEAYLGFPAQGAKIKICALVAEKFVIVLSFMTFLLRQTQNISCKIFK